MVKLLATGLAATAGLVMASAATAATVNLDFSTYAAGSIVNSVPGGTVSLAAGPGAGGAPVVGYGYFDSVLSLNNSTNWGPGTDGYPTGPTISFFFGTDTSAINFTFSNYGTGNGTFVSAFNAGNVLLETLVIDSINGFAPVSLTSTGVRKLVFDNNSGGTSNWIFGIGQLSYTNAVPEPASWAMLIAGFGLVGAASRRRRSAIAA